MRKTAWEKRVVVEQNQNQDPFEQLQDELSEALGRYDRDKQELMAQFKLLATNPEDQEGWDLLGPLVYSQTQSFVNLVSLIDRTSTSSDDAKEFITKLWVQDDNERAIELGKNTDPDYYQLMPEIMIAGMLDSVYRTKGHEDSFEGQIKYHYTRNLEVDIHNFTYAVRSELHTDDSGDETEEDEIENIDNTQNLSELVEALSMLANKISQDFIEETEDGITFSKSFTDVNGEIISNFSFGAQREYNIDHNGKQKVITHYQVASQVYYQLPGFKELPEYLRKFSLQVFEQIYPDKPVTEEDLTGKDVSVGVDFTFATDVSDEGNFQPFNRLSLVINGEALPLIERSAMPPGIEDQTDTSENNEDIFKDLFSEDEVLVIQQLEEEMVLNDFTNHMIENIQKKYNDICYATQKQRIKMAQGLAKEISNII